jgi:hypothetical protein
MLLLGRYVGRKMFDLPPWPAREEQHKKAELPWKRFQRWLLALRELWQRRMHSPHK